MTIDLYGHMRCVYVCLCLWVPAVCADGNWTPKQEAEIDELAPLGALLSRVRADFPGRVLKFELEHEDYHGTGQWTYEVKLLTADGRVLKIEYDAATLQLLEQKHQSRHKRREATDD